MVNQQRLFAKLFAKDDVRKERIKLANLSFTSAALHFQRIVRQALLRQRGWN